MVNILIIQFGLPSKIFYLCPACMATMAKAVCTRDFHEHATCPKEVIWVCRNAQKKGYLGILLLGTKQKHLKC